MKSAATRASVASCGTRAADVLPAAGDAATADSTAADTAAARARGAEETATTKCVRTGRLPLAPPAIACASTSNRSASRKGAKSAAVRRTLPAPSPSKPTSRTASDVVTSSEAASAAAAASRDGAEAAHARRCVAETPAKLSASPHGSPARLCSAASAAARAGDDGRTRRAAHSSNIRHATLRVRIAKEEIKAGNRCSLQRVCLDRRVYTLQRVARGWMKNPKLAEQKSTPSHHRLDDDHTV